MIAFIIAIIFAVIIVNYYIELAVKRKYEKRNKEMLKNINELDERKRIKKK